MAEVKYTFEEIVEFEEYLGTLTNYKFGHGGRLIVVDEDGKADLEKTWLLDELKHINSRRAEILKQFKKD